VYGRNSLCAQSLKHLEQCLSDILNKGLNYFLKNMFGRRNQRVYNNSDLAKFLFSIKVSAATSSFVTIGNITLVKIYEFIFNDEDLFEKWYKLVREDRLLSLLPAGKSDYIHWARLHISFGLSEKYVIDEYRTKSEKYLKTGGVLTSDCLEEIMQSAITGNYKVFTGKYFRPQRHIRLESTSKRGSLSLNFHSAELCKANSNPFPHYLYNNPINIRQMLIDDEDNVMEELENIRYEIDLSERQPELREYFDLTLIPHKNPEPTKTRETEVEEEVIDDNGNKTYVKYNFTAREFSLPTITIHDDWNISSILNEAPMFAVISTAAPQDMFLYSNKLVICEVPGSRSLRAELMFLVGPPEIIGKDYGLFRLNLKTVKSFLSLEYQPEKSYYFQKEFRNCFDERGLEEEGRLTKLYKTMEQKPSQIVQLTKENVKEVVLESIDTLIERTDACIRAGINDFLDVKVEGLVNLYNNKEIDKTMLQFLVKIHTKQSILEEIAYIFKRMALKEENTKFEHSIADLNKRDIDRIKKHLDNFNHYQDYIPINKNTRLFNELNTLFGQSLCSILNDTKSLTEEDKDILLVLWQSLSDKFRQKYGKDNGKELFCDWILALISNTPVSKHKTDDTIILKDCLTSLYSEIVKKLDLMTNYKKKSSKVFLEPTDDLYREQTEMFLHK